MIVSIIIGSMFIISIIIGIYNSEKYIKKYKLDILEVSNYREKFVKMSNDYFKKNKINKKYYKELILKKDVVSKIVGDSNNYSKVYNINYNQYIGLSLMDNVISYFRRNIQQHTLQELSLDLDDFLLSKIGYIEDFKNNFIKYRFSPFKLFNIGYSFILDEILSILNLDYLKLKTDIIKKISLWITSIILLINIIKMFI
jgi:hypothetical protein